MHVCPGTRMIQQDRLARRTARMKAKAIKIKDLWDILFSEIQPLRILPKIENRDVWVLAFLYSLFWIFCL
jgi:hypothetical protein